YVEKLPRLKRGWFAGLVLIFIGTLMLSVLFGNAMLQIWHEQAFTLSEPVASSIAFIFGWLPPAAGMVLFFVFWWLATFTILVFLVYKPHTIYIHLIWEMVNVLVTDT